METSSGGMVTITGGKWTTYRKMAEETVDVAESVGGLTRVPCPTADLPLHGASSRVSVSEPAELTPNAARVRYAARHELARTVEDVLARRCRTLFLDATVAREAAPEVARIMAEELDRPPDWCVGEVESFCALARSYEAGPAGG